MGAVMEAERQLGHQPHDIAAEKRGYDIESRHGQTGEQRFIEVKGRAKSADTITVTRNEILTAFNKPEQFILALVEVDDGVASLPVYCREVFDQPPRFAESSVNLDISIVVTKGEHPS